MSNPEESKPKGIMKHDEDHERRAPRKTISFEPTASVVVYNQNSRQPFLIFSAGKHIEYTQQAIQQSSSESLLQVSSNLKSKPEQELNLLAEVQEEHKEPQQRSPMSRQRDVSPIKQESIVLAPVIIEEIPDRNDVIRQRLENLTKRKSLIPSLNTNLPPPPVKIEQPKEVVIAQRPSQQKPSEQGGKRLSDAYRRGLKHERMALNEQQIKSIQKEYVDLDDCPSNNKKRLNMMKINNLGNSRQTMNMKELRELYMMDSQEKTGSYKSPIRQPEERKVAEPNQIPSHNRITLGFNQVAMMLRTGESDEKNQRSFEKSPSFKEKGFENPRLNKYLQEQPVQYRIPSFEADYSQKRTKVISYLNELLETKPQMTDSKSRPGKNLHLQNRKLALNTRITSLKEQLSNAQKKSRHLSDSVKLLKTEISGLVQQADISKMLNMLLGVKSLRFYPDIQLRAMDQGGDRIEYYVELNLNYDILIKIKKKVGKQPDVRIANTILSDQQTGLLNAKAIASIMKSTFIRNCSHRSMFETVLFLRNQYTSLCNLQKQLTFINQMTEVKSTILSASNDRLTIIIPSRRDDSELELKIDLGSWNWTQHIKTVIDQHQEQVNMYQTSCKPSHLFLVDFMSKLFKKVI